MSERETPEEKARSQAYADGVLAERRHTRRALDERDVQRRRAEAAELVLVELLAAAREYREFAETHGMDTFLDLARDRLDRAIAKAGGT